MVLIATLSACQFLVEVREPPTEVSYGGTIYDGVPTGDADAVLTDGTVDFMVPTVDLEEPRQDLIDDGLLWVGSQPFSSSPGYWQVTLPVETELAVRMETPSSYPSVFTGRSPSWSGYWFAGVLFTWDRVYTDEFLYSLTEQLGVTAADLDDGERVHLWGVLRDEEEAARLEGRKITIIDGDGAEATVYPFELTEDGFLSQTYDAPVHYFYAFNLAPGDIQLVLEGPSGDTVTEHYPTRGGDMIGAWWLGVPE
jgi:hypothetical protein